MVSRLRSLVRTLLGRRNVERALADELTFHLEARTEHWRQQGLSDDHARRRARLEFGAFNHYEEECRRLRGLSWIEGLSNDVVYAWRQLRSAPGFTAISAATLALAIGANAAVVSVIHAVTWQTLPVPQPHELRELAWIEPDAPAWQISYNGSMRPNPGGGRVATSFSYSVYEALRDRGTRFSHLFLFDRQSVNLGLGGREQPAEALLVSGTFSSGLGVRTILGRPIGPADDAPGAAVSVVLTHRGWQRLLSGDAEPIGRAVGVNGVPGVVVGVTEPLFTGVEPGWPVDMLVPVIPAFAAIERDRPVFADGGYWGFRVMGRRAADATDESARAEAQALLHQALPPRLNQSDPALVPRVILNPAARGLDSLRRSYAPPLYLLWGIVAAVLGVACANIAGLLLARYRARTRDLTLRLALGAGRWRLVRQLLTESLALATLGATAAVPVALALRGHLLPWLNQDDPPIELPLGFGIWLLLVVAGTCLLVGLLCGTLPALWATRSSVALVEPGRVVPSGSSRSLVGKTLVALQVAVSLALVVSAGLFVRTLQNLRGEPLGFNPDALLLFQWDATSRGYADTRVRDLYDHALERLRAIPGVHFASMSQYGLVTGGARRDDIRAFGATSGQGSVAVHIHFIAPDYFETMAIPLIRGRDITQADRSEAALVALVNDALAQQLAGATRDAVDRFIEYVDAPGGLPIRIVGIVGDARFAALREPAPPTLYLPASQHPVKPMTFAARVGRDPAAFGAAVRRTIESLDPYLPVTDVRTQQAQIDAAIRPERLFAYAGSSFATLTVLLATLGIYGTLALAVASRTQEIGVRMALGADRLKVVRMVLRESMSPVCAGLVLGLPASIATSRVLEHMLFGVTARDTGTLLAAVLILTAAALVAAWLPARRAARVDPLTALRTD
jgi:predicted permease